MVWLRPIRRDAAEALLSWRDRAYQLVDDLFPTPSAGKPTPEWMEGRTRLKQFLGIEVTLASKSWQAVIVLAPLVSGLLGSLVGI
jgi:hypothetical protein